MGETNLVRMKLLLAAGLITMTAMAALILSADIQSVPILNLYKNISSDTKHVGADSRNSGNNVSDKERHSYIRSQNSVEVADKDTPSYNRKQHTIVVFNPTYWLPLQNVNLVLSSKCTYKNCKISTDRMNLQNQSAIMYILTEAPRLPETPTLLPSSRNPDQVWIFTWVEPPVYNGWNEHACKNKYWRNTVNWTMTYTRDADIFFPYGQLIKRTLPPAKNYSEIFHRKTKMAAWFVSHCDTAGKREIYVNELKRHGISVDIYGKCAGNRAHEAVKRRLIDQDYKFYFAFENSFCKDYITEKFFAYFSLDVVLVVRGAVNYSKLFPSNTFINTADFKSAKDLADHLIMVSSNEKRYSNYLRNKDKFEVISRETVRNEGFCELCKKLNNLDRNRRIYTDFVERVHQGTCLEPKDVSTLGSNTTSVFKPINPFVPSVPLKGHRQTV